MARQQIKDEYEMIAEIGAGGMATVHKAIQKSLDRTVAIKELKRTYHGDNQIVRRFERESRVAASLQHENIVHIYDYWKKPTYCIVMEYVDGVNLAEVIEKTGPLPVDVGVMIAIQVCNALDYAHMRGLIHRDIKPSNIMIKRNGEVKLMDFGIAQSRNLESLTMPGTLIGTPAYMSPEQILGQQLDVRSDIFSFGIVLYEMFTGVKPFTDEETRAVSAKILKDNFAAPRRVNSDIPRSLQRVVKKCLRKKPQRRFGAMLEVEKKLGKRIAGRTTKAASLRRIADYLVSLNVFEAAPEHETMVLTGGLPGGGRLKPALFAAIIVTLLAAGGALYYYQTQMLPNKQPSTAPSTPLVKTPLVPQPPAATQPPAITPPPTVAPGKALAPAAAQPETVAPTPVAPMSPPSVSAAAPGQKKEESAQKTGVEKKKKKKKKKKKPQPEQ
jgi:tRNA A-37 threonylcarbamoyl transferase component Bud32